MCKDSGSERFFRGPGKASFGPEEPRRIPEAPSRHPPSLLQLILFVLLSFTLMVSPSSCAPTQETDWDGFEVTGKLSDPGGDPVQGALVFAYRDGVTPVHGPADAMAEPSERDGTYVLILPEGTYTLVARKRQSGSVSGPLGPGDLFGRFPAAVRGGVRDRSRADITLRVFQQGLEGDLTRVLSTPTRLRGVVVDPGGVPVPGAIVFAYQGPVRKDPPDYAAAPADGRGRFEISLPQGGLYTIGARTGSGGRPRPDDSLGFWGPKDQPIEIEGGTVTEGVRIVVEPYRKVGD